MFVYIFIYFTKLVAADPFVTSLNFYVYSIIRHVFISAFPIIYFSDFSFISHLLDSKIMCHHITVCSIVISPR